MANPIELFDVPSFWFQKETGILNIGTTPQEVVTITTPDLEPGVYQIGYSIMANFNGQKNQPMTVTMTGTYGGASNDISVGDNDGNDVMGTYFFPKDHAGGAITFGLNVSKSATFTAQLDVQFVDVMINRVG